MDATLTVDTSPFSQVDRRFFYVLFASMFVHALAATWLARQPYVATEEDTSEVRPFAPVTLPPLLAIPKTFPAVKLAPQAPRAGGPKKAPGGPQNGGARPSALSGLLAGALDDLKGKTDVDAALSGAKAGHVDTSTLAVRRERGPQETQAIGPITTNTPGSDGVGIGEHVDAPALKPVIDDVIIDEVPDPTAFMRFINARKSALASCYEMELKRNRSLKGRITVQLTVATDGRAREVDVDPGSLGSRAVAECIQALVRRWTFPVKPGEELPLQFPVLFSPAQ